jgi:transposase-like protein
MKEDIEREEIIAEYLAGKSSYRKLEKKYGYNRTTINEWVMEHQGRGKKARRNKLRRQPDEQQKINLKELQEVLRKEKLRNQVLEAMLDIGKERYGIDLRKKAGTKQS